MRKISLNLVPEWECRIFALKSKQENRMHFYFFGWEEEKKALMLDSVEVDTNSFEAVEIYEVGPVLDYLAKKDDRYKIEDQHKFKRIRVT